MSSDQSPASRHVPVGIKSSGAAFVKENTGNIKDFYKISKCIGRGKCPQSRKTFHLYIIIILIRHSVLTPNANYINFKSKLALNFNVH